MYCNYIIQNQKSIDMCDFVTGLQFFFANVYRPLHPSMLFLIGWCFVDPSPGQEFFVFFFSLRNQQAAYGEVLPRSCIIAWLARTLFFSTLKLVVGRFFVAKIRRDRNW